MASIKDELGDALLDENGESIWDEEGPDWTDGWTHFNPGSNQALPDNGKCVYLDYDDITVVNSSTSPTLKDDGNGNLFIGPITPVSANVPTIISNTGTENVRSNVGAEQIAGN